MAKIKCEYPPPLQHPLMRSPLPRRTPSGWCSSETKSSTAMADAMGAQPGRVTVHCWSSVRPSVELSGPTTSPQK